MIILRCPFCFRKLRSVMRRGLFQLICQDHGQITKPSVELVETKEEITDGILG